MNIKHWVYILELQKLIKSTFQIRCIYNKYKNYHKGKISKCVSNESFVENNKEGDSWDNPYMKQELTKYSIRTCLAQSKITENTMNFMYKSKGS